LGAQAMVSWPADVIAEAELWDRIRNTLERGCVGSGIAHSGPPLLGGRPAHEKQMGASRRRRKWLRQRKTPTVQCPRNGAVGVSLLSVRTLTCLFPPRRHSSGTGRSIKFAASSGSAVERNAGYWTST